MGNIKEVLPRGMYKVKVECEGQLITKSIFSHQTVLFKEKQDVLPFPETSPTLSLLNLYNFISDFRPTVRKEMYHKGLRSAKGVSYGSINELFQVFYLRPEAGGRTFRPVVCHSTSGTLRSILAIFFYYCIIYFSY